MIEFKHISVMLNECIDGLNIKSNGIYVDGTLGGAGHSYEIAKKLDSNGRLIVFDKDIDAINVSKERLCEFNNITFIHDDYKNMRKVLTELGIEYVDGILLDLGVSSYQLDNRDRGFSYLGSAELDMRMNQQQALSAKEVVNDYSEEKLTEIFFTYGEERFSRKVAANIVKARPINTTEELARIIEKSIPANVRFKNGNPCKKVFQAIRIEVNEELEGLQTALLEMGRSLKVGGRMCVITFHSLEDRICKKAFNELQIDCICPPHQPICTCSKRREVILINKKPIMATESELDTNSRSASAKLRIIEKI